MITVTGATGHLGRLVIDALLQRGVPAGELVAAVRTPERASDIEARGVQVRHADYTEPETLADAFAGTERLLLISSSEVGQRTDQHRNAVEAAVVAGVDLLVYTSILRADTSTMLLAREHLETEEIIDASGLQSVLLRNGWYLENYTENLAPAFQHGAVVGSAGEGKVSGAARADYAAAAATVLTASAESVKPVYELGGSPGFTMSDLAAVLSEQSGREIAYRDLPTDDYAKILMDSGVPDGFAAVLADSDRATAAGELYTDSSDLEDLIGRKSTPLATAVSTAVEVVEPLTHS